NDGFAPSPAEVEDARALIAAWQEGNGGVATYRGRMIEQLHVDEAERALAMADAIAGRDQG
ncbi:MAG: CoA ester lyase, partial [Cutibacterium granulosum]|nr:CoA ester lyase [Cutibacterium granulosum]